jgi:RimJ/RimL family protein N-acetyltransferase
MPYYFEPIIEQQALTVAAWRYPPPYELYNPDPAEFREHFRALMDAENNYHAITDYDGTLVGFCCFGPDARVAGGVYTGDALDVGAGLRPDLTGQSRGHEFLGSILYFARESRDIGTLRTTVAAFNERALRVCQKLGFEIAERFARPTDGVEFVVLAWSAPR